MDAPLQLAQRLMQTAFSRITPSGTDIDCVKYDNAFRTCFSDPTQGVVSAQYIKDNALGTKIGIIYDSSDTYSDGVTKAFVEEDDIHRFGSSGKRSIYQRHQNRYESTAAKAAICRCRPGIYSIYYSEASTILSQTNEIGYQPTFYGCDGMDGILSVENFDVSLAENLMFLTPFITTAQDEKTQNFVTKYREKYDMEPTSLPQDATTAYTQCTQLASRQVRTARCPLRSCARH